MTLARRQALAELVVAVLVFVVTLAIRIRGISTHFWLLEDQIRDWGIALRPFSELPLVGPPTHVGGYTIGPAYYWLMWAIRVTIGPWFDNLPHGGGVGQGIVESTADALLVIAMWRRTQSVWFGLAGGVLIATAAYDVALSAIVWTTVIASAFGKIAIALIFLRWDRSALWRVAVIAGIAWCAVHVYTGAIFVTAGVFAALLAGPIGRRDWPMLGRRAAVIVAVVVALQIPYMLHQFRTGFQAAAMGAVTGNVRAVLSGQQAPEIGKSIDGFFGAVNFIQVMPWTTPLIPWVLAVTATVLALRYRRDPTIVVLLLVPQISAIAGYAIFLGALDHYYYIPVVPVVVVTMVLALALPSRFLVGRVIGIALLAGAAALVPSRLRFAATMHRIPQYGMLVRAAREIAHRQERMRAIREDFALPPTCDPVFLYTILGGRIDAAAPWEAVISADGQVTYRQASE
jgi:hypothetical protein